MKNYIVTIARQYGAGGRLVGHKLADRLGAEYIDNNIIVKAAKINGIDVEVLKSFDEKPGSVINGFFVMPMQNGNLFTPMYSDMEVRDKLFYTQAKIIREETAGKMAVVVGRCGDYILRDRDNLIRIFLYADEQCRMDRIINEYKIKPTKMRKFLKKADKQRASYSNTYSDTEWGNPINYELAINTSKLTPEQVVEIIYHYVENFDKK